MSKQLHEGFVEHSHHLKGHLCYLNPLSSSAFKEPFATTPALLHQLHKHQAMRQPPGREPFVSDEPGDSMWRARMAPRAVMTAAGGDAYVLFAEQK